MQAHQKRQDLLVELEMRGEAPVCELLGSLGLQDLCR